MSDTSLWTFITHADLVVKLVLIILCIASIISWTIILQRARLIRKTKKLIQSFEQLFSKSVSLGDLQKQIPEKQSDLARIFHAGCNEFVRLSAEPNLKPEVIIENSQRAMRLAAQECMRELDQQVPILATIGSTAPYVGLFGTVWGIMSAFSTLGGVQQATIAMVAPGISEALIATAIGLFAAIPAVIAYNRFANQLDIISQSFDMFQDELTGILQQHVNTRAGGVVSHA